MDRRSKHIQDKRTTVIEELFKAYKDRLESYGVQDFMKDYGLDHSLSCLCNSKVCDRTDCTGCELENAHEYFKQNNLWSPFKNKNGRYGKEPK